jgi:uncharacterized protein (TIGR03437 family)
MENVPSVPGFLVSSEVFIMRRKVHLVSLGILVVGLFCAECAMAQEKGSFAGVVELDASQPLAGARVNYNNVPKLIHRPGGGYTYAEPPVSGTVIAGPDGRFMVSDTPAGEYILCAYGTQLAQLPSCQWQFGIYLISFNVNVGATTEVGPLIIRTGAMVTFQIDDPAGLIRENDLRGFPANGPRFNITLGISWRAPDGIVHRYGADFIGKTGSRWTFRVPVLKGVALQMYVNFNSSMQFLDPSGSPISSNVPTGSYQANDSSGFTINLSVRPTGVVIQGAVTNGASFDQSLAAGGIATVFDQNITSATGIFQANTLPLPTEINGTAVIISGVRCPLYAVARVNGLEQVNFQVPSGLNVPGVNVVVSLNGVERPAISTNLFPAMPGIFTVDGAHGAIQHGSDFRLVTSTDPAIRGAPVVIYATGLGPVTPDPGAGNPAPSSPPAITIYPITATVGGFPATVEFAGLAAGFVGLNQVNIVVPENAPTGEVDVVLSALVDDLTFSSPPAKMFVQ